MRLAMVIAPFGLEVPEDVQQLVLSVADKDVPLWRMAAEEPGMPLRPPETYHEALHLIMHVRALANDMARHFGMDDQVRPDDDIKPKSGSGVDGSGSGA